METARKAILGFILISAIFNSTLGYGQDNEEEQESEATEQAEKKVEQDTLKLPVWPPRAIRFGVDLYGLGISAFGSNTTSLEANMDVVFGKYFLSFDYGTFDITHDNTGFEYNSSGSFFRAGVDVNFLKKEPDEAALFFGLKYGRAQFDDNLTYTILDENIGDVIDAKRSNNGLGAGWFEMNFGLKVRVWKQFMLGATTRFKFGLSIEDTTELEPFDIPGYGRASENIWWGFNYYLIYRIPLMDLKGGKGSIMPKDDK